MTRQNMYLCPVCRNNVPASEAIRIKTRYYHKECYEKKIAQEKNKLKKEKEIKKEREKANSHVEKEIRIKEAISEEEAKEKQRVINKIKDILNVEFLDVKYYSSLDRIKKKYVDFTWDGIYNSLVYFYEIKENQPYNNVVGIIPDVYTEANRFFKDLELIKPGNVKDLYKKKKVKITLKNDTKQCIDINKLGE